MKAEYFKPKVSEISFNFAEHVAQSSGGIDCIDYDEQVSGNDCAAMGMGLTDPGCNYGKTDVLF